MTYKAWFIYFDIGTKRNLFWEKMNQKVRGDDFLKKNMYNFVETHTFDEDVIIIYEHRLPPSKSIQKVKKMWKLDD